MEAKTLNARMNEAHARAAEIILEEMEAVRDMPLSAEADRVEMLAKLGSVMHGLRITPEPFDARALASMIGAAPLPGIEPEGTGGGVS